MTLLASEFSATLVVGVDEAASCVLPSSATWDWVERGGGGNRVHIPMDLALKNSIMVSPNLDLNLKSLVQGNLYLVNGRYGAL